MQGTTQPTASGGFQTSNVLERCGSRRQIPLPRASPYDSTANGQALMVSNGSSDEADPFGIFLPSLHPFRVAVRKFMASQPYEWTDPRAYELALTDKWMYLLGPLPPADPCGNHPEDPCPPTPVELWSAPAPKERATSRQREPHKSKPVE